MKWLAYNNNNKKISKGISFKTISTPQVSEEDMVFLYQLYASTRIEEMRQTTWSDQQKHDFLLQQYNAQHSHYFSHYPKGDYLIVEKNKKPIGRIYLDRDEKSICLLDIALIPESRNKGLGTELLKQLIKEAQEGQKKITIHVESFNPAYQLYQKLGFKHVEDKGVYQYMEWYPIA
jgi:RimJ/RimL family protein N-acetyltransferase